MGAIGGMLGLNGGAGGTGFSGPQMANITDPTNQGQINNAYSGVQNSLQGQQDLLSALQQQQGIQNQSQVYGQLQNVAQGVGPNPALAQLNQTTGQNVAAQNALMAGQRGAGSNVGLIARQAGQLGAQQQQAAVGQGATLAAQQQLGAIGQAGALATQQAGQQIGQTNQNTAAQQAEQGQLLGAQSAYNTAQVGSQASVNSANAALASQAMGNQASAIGGLAQGAGAAGMLGTGIQSLALGAARGGEVPAIQQQKAPAQSVLSQALYGQSMSSGGMSHDYRGGGKVEAKAAREKAVTGGDNKVNDKIPAVLSEKEIVLPRSVTMSKDPVGESAKFVASVIAKRKMGH